MCIDHWVLSYPFHGFWTVWCDGQKTTWGSQSRPRGQGLWISTRCIPRSPIKAELKNREYRGNLAENVQKANTGLIRKYWYDRPRGDIKHKTRAPWLKGKIYHRPHPQSMFPLSQIFKMRGPYLVSPGHQNAFWSTSTNSDDLLTITHSISGHKPPWGSTFVWF